VDDIGDTAHDTIVVALNFAHEQNKRLLVTHVQLESINQLFHRLVWLERNVGYVGVDHKREQVENYIRVTLRKVKMLTILASTIQNYKISNLPSQMEKRVAAVLLEILNLLVLLAVGSISTAHAIRHVLGPLNSGLEGFRITAENVTEVNVQDLAVLGDQNVVVVAITDPQYIGYYHVTRFKYKQK
jgi:hypothetical protein